MASPEALRTHNYEKTLDKVQFIGWPRTMRINETRYTNIGYEITAKREEPITHKRRVVPGDTAIHEATHAVPAAINGTPIEQVSIIPGPGYLGITKLGRPDAISALAPHATGASGTGHDVFIASLMVPNISSAENVARSIVYNNKEKINEVATDLEENKTMSGSQVKAAMDRVDKKKVEGDKATVFIKNPDGFEQRIPDLDIRDGIVILPTDNMIPSKHYELPKEGIIFSNN